MANLILPRDVLTPKLRRDVITAVNDLKERGLLPLHAHYAFVKKGLEWGVEFWCGSRHCPEGGVAWAKAADVCAAVAPSVILGAARL